MSMKKELEKIIKDRIKLYLVHPDEIDSRKTGEERVKDDYKGRQILELLQNADDEQSDELLFELNTINKTLEISNRGQKCNPFSVDGIKSLMIPDKSPKKDNKQYIGNKGLGFRSIINWSHSITIKSNNLDIKFSKDIAERIKCEHNLKSDLPILAIPEITDSKTEWTTSIYLNYIEKEEEYIIDQLNNFKNESLLFLNHIQRLTIRIDNDVIVSSEKIIDGDNIVLSDKENCITEWRIFKKEDEIPKEYLDDNGQKQKYFNLKIATQDNIDNNFEYLFSYLPTDIKIDFPFIIHGTFDLNSSRNDIIKSDKNSFIIKKLATFIIEVAKDDFFTTNKEVNYNALKILTYRYQHPSLIHADFYNELDDARKNQAIFPCLDNNYKKQDDVIYLDMIAHFVKKTNNEILFPNLLIPTNDYEKEILKKYQLNKDLMIDPLHELNQNIYNIDHRVEWIKILYNLKLKNNDSNIKFDCLIDDDNRLIINKAYTPIRANRKFNLPNYVKVKFMNKGLFNKLTLLPELLDNSENDKARGLQRKLKEITNLHSYEPAEIIEDIINSANQAIQSKDTDIKSIVKQMVKCLYEHNNERPYLNEKSNIQLLNKNHELCKANQLFLNNDLTKELFDNELDDHDYIIDYTFFDIGDNDDVEDFFKWLGVQQFPRISNDNIMVYSGYIYHDYIKYILNNFRDITDLKSYKIDYQEIYNFDQFKSIPKEKLLLWILQDNNIKQAILENKLEFAYTQGQERKYRYKYDAPTYIRYQFYTTGLFKDYLLDNSHITKIINEWSLDEYEALKNFDNQETELILLKLGAVNNFSNLSIEKVREVIANLPNKNKNGKNAQAIYKRAVEHYDKNKQKLNANIKLWAEKHGKKDYFDHHEVFYVSKKLPQSIIHQKAVIDYPPRQNINNITDFFNIKHLNEDINIKIIDKLVEENITNEFNKFFKSKMRYILAERIKPDSKNSDRNDNFKKTEKQKLTKIIIELCKYTKYSFDSDEYNLDINDYVIDEHGAYIIAIDTSKAFDAIKQDIDFQETIADIIGLAFDIQNISKFRDIIRNSNKYNTHVLEKDNGLDILEEAKALLNEDDNKTAFWKIIYKLTNKPFHEEFNIKHDLNISDDVTNIDYENVEKNYNFIKMLFNKLNINITDYNKKTDKKISFESYHQNALNSQFAAGSYNNIEKSIYQYCLDNNQQQYFNQYKENYDSLKSTYISELAKQNEYNIIAIMDIEDFKKRLDFLSDNLTNEDYSTIYDQNKLKYKNLVEDISSQEVISLWYFKNIDSLIKPYLKQHDQDPINNKNNSSNAPLPANVIDGSAIIINAPQDSESTNSYSKHSVKKDKENKDKGDKTTDIVYRFLKNQYQYVRDYSKDNDKQGYDIEYIDNTGQIKCVEVKSYNGSHFFMSRNELQEANKSPEHYEIFLVPDNGNDIVRIKYQDINQENLIAEKYKAYYKIKN